MREKLNELSHILTLKNVKSSKQVLWDIAFVIYTNYHDLIDITCTMYVYIVQEESEEQENIAPANKRPAEPIEPPPAKKSKLGKKTGKVQNFYSIFLDLNVLLLHTY